MAIRIVQETICDAKGHEEKCPKQEEILSIQLIDPETGEFRKKELCLTEFAKYTKALELVRSFSYPDEERAASEENRRHEERTEAIDAACEKAYQRGRDEALEEAKPKGKGVSGNPGKESDDPEFPLFKAVRAWWALSHSDGIKGKMTRTRQVVKDFLGTPLGKAWADWEPGKPEPVKGADGVWVVPQQQELPTEEKPADGETNGAPVPALVTAFSG